MSIRFKNIKRIWRGWIDDRYNDENEQSDGKLKKNRSVQIKVFLVWKLSWGTI